MKKIELHKRKDAHNNFSGRNTSAAVIAEEHSQGGCEKNVLIVTIKQIINLQPESLRMIRAAQIGTPECIANIKKEKERREDMKQLWKLLHSDNECFSENIDGLGEKRLIAKYIEVWK